MLLPVGYLLLGDELCCFDTTHQCDRHRTSVTPTAYNTIKNKYDNAAFRSSYGIA